MLSDKFAKILKDKGLTQSSYAEKVGMPRQNINSLIQGRRQPSIKDVKSLVDVFPDIDLNWLIKDEKNLRVAEDSTPYESKNRNLEIKQLAKDLQALADRASSISRHG